MERKIGIVLLCVVGVAILSLISDRSKDIRIIIDLAIIIVCGISGIYLLWSKKKEEARSKNKKITKKIIIGSLTFIITLILSIIYFDINYDKQEQTRMGKERKGYTKQLEIEQERKEKEGEVFLEYWDKPYPLDHQEWSNADFDLQWKFTDQTKKYSEIYITCEWVMRTHLKDRGNLTFYARPTIQLLDEDKHVIASDTDEYTTTARSQRYSGKFELKKQDAMRVRTTGVKWRHH